MRPISSAHEYDVPALAELNNQFSPQGLTLPRSEAFVEAHLQDYRVVRDDDGRIVGCVCIDEYSPSLVELVALAVAPSYQGRGLGRQLIASAVELATKRGYPEIFAVSFSDALFKNCGFSFVEVARYPEKKARYDRISTDEWTVGQKHCFALALPSAQPVPDEPLAVA